MATINNPLKELEKKLGVLEENSNRIKSIQQQGVISLRFAEYCNSLLILDHLAEEAETFVNIQDPRFEKSLLDMRLMLDSVAQPYIMDSLQSTELYEDYRELYFLAQERYDKTIDRVATLLGEIA